MTRSEKARRIGKILDRLFPDAAVPLDHVDPYTLLVAVVLSAQCTDERVNQITPALFARASTPEAMAKLSPAEIEKRIRGRAEPGRRKTGGLGIFAAGWKKNWSPAARTWSR